MTFIESDVSFEGLPSESPQPGEQAFVNDLKFPLWSDHRWTPRPIREGEVWVGGGIVCHSLLHKQPPLEAALDDFAAFCKAGGIPQEKGYEVKLLLDGSEEGFRITVESTGCLVSSGTATGIQQGVFELERMMRRAGGPFLPLGIISRRYWVQTRLSRCFFGPIKRPPLNRDELADDVEYYPDEYLNKLAHDGVNALWISVSFHDLCRTRYFPEHGQDAERRFSKLRRTIDTCARYGIRVFVFVIEPTAFGPLPEQKSLDDLRRHPELGGRRAHGMTYFCAGGEDGAAYLEEASRRLFENAPGLGGILNIVFGERPTHCFSASDALIVNECPRCTAIGPVDGIARVLTALERGVHGVDENAEVIAWFYVPYICETSKERSSDIQKILTQAAAKIPSGVTLQVNFESLGEEVQLGAPRAVLDYSLAHIGPSRFFEMCAVNAKNAGVKMSAKIQAACSHEVATVPFVPVPGNLYRKYKRMRELGITTVMQSWYFGNYPSVMTRAAGLCSQEPFPDDEEAFLYDLAREDWHERDVNIVVKAWKIFGEAYRNFPANLTFGHYGPAHDSIAWPLYLEPVDLPIAPSWKLDFPPSGDRVGECISHAHGFEEILELMQKVCTGWNDGWLLLEKILPHYKDQPGRLLDLGVAEALNLQFGSAHRVLYFYYLREKLPWCPPGEGRGALNIMKSLVEEEIAATLRLADLSEVDRRLGFHSEAEGYKYFPEKLRWRAGLLERLLKVDFPRVEQMLNSGKPLFTKYTGVQPEGSVAYSVEINENVSEPLPWSLAARETVATGSREFTWQALHCENSLYLKVSCKGGEIPRLGCSLFDAEHLVISLEPRRLWPVHRFYVNANGQTWYNNLGVLQNPQWAVRSALVKGGWEVIYTISLDSLRNADELKRPIRINIERQFGDNDYVSWIPKHPLRERLHYGAENPGDLGWLIFSAKKNTCGTDRNKREFDVAV